MDITNYYERIKNYNKVADFFKSIKKNQCLIALNKTESHTEYIFDDNKIILKKRIGSNSNYGIIYLTITSLFTLLFASKLTPQTFRNNFEIKIAKYLSKKTIQDLNPHFLIIHNNFICLNNIEQYDLPSLIKYKEYNILIMEFADGNLKEFLKMIDDPNLIKNAYQQIFISILSFHYFTKGIYHSDCHYNNFLYIKINKGGYFHYNIYGQDIYIENLGYIWIIWDFGLVRNEKEEKKKRLQDYYKMTNSFLILSSKTTTKFKLIHREISDIFNILYTFRYIYSLSDKKFFNYIIEKNKNLFSFTYNNLSFIINEKPYIIK
jgi:hypothetical protein